MEEAAARAAARPRRVTVWTKLVEAPGSKTVSVDAPHSDRIGWGVALQDAMGSRSFDFVSRTLGEVASVLDPHGADGATPYNAALALIGAVAPQNELEAALASQIAATNGLSMDCMARAARADRLDQRDTYINQATKLSRTMAAQIEALNKLRTGGKQRVEVAYIDARNSQNVIGVQAGGGGEQCPIGAQPDVPGLEIAPGVPLRSEDPARYALPAAGHAREQALPETRRQGWRAERGAERQLEARPADQRDEGAAPDDRGREP